MNIYKNKKEYNSPEIYRIQLDNKISLELESELDKPQGDPSGNGWDSHNQKNISDPFKNQLG